MLSTKKIIAPNNLINLAKKTSSVPAAIVCANQEDSMLSSKQAFELGLIKPVFIGNKRLIEEEADKLAWNINSFIIIEKNSEQDAAIEGASLAKNNKIKS